MGNVTLSRSNFIHLLRWTSAFLVVFNHLRSILFKDYPLISHPNLVDKIFYFITGLGHQSVVVFFVLSGYLIAGSVLSQVAKHNFDIKLYAVKRISRLYAVLIFAIILTVVLDHAGIYLDQAGLYTGKIKAATLGFSIADRLSYSYTLTSLFMLQAIVLPPVGSNSPLWSLAYEFWYYVLFPCFVLSATFTKAKSKKAISYVLILLVLIVFLPLGVKLSFLIWLIGLIPFYLSFKNEALKWLFFTMLIAWLLFKKSIPTDPFLYDAILGLIVAFWLSSFKDFKQDFGRGFLKFNETLSSFSYSTYLVHFPIIMFILTCIKKYYLTGTAMEQGLAAYSIFVIVFLFVMICAYIIAMFTEFKTTQFRLFLERIFLGKVTR